MSVTDGTRRELPARPSKEHLRKQAKRLADRQSLGLAQAQRKIAAGYGFATWADLMHRVDSTRGGEQIGLGIGCIGHSGIAHLPECSDVVDVDA